MGLRFNVKELYQDDWSNHQATTHIIRGLLCLAGTYVFFEFLNKSLVGKIGTLIIFGFISAGYVFYGIRNWQLKGFGFSLRELFNHGALENAKSGTLLLFGLIWIILAIIVNCMSE